LANKNTINNMQPSRRKFIKLSAAGTALAYTPTLLGAANSEKKVTANTKQFLQACQDGDMDVVKRLLVSDLRLLSAKDEKGRSGFAIALLAGHQNIGNLLKETGYQTDLHESVLDRDWDRFNELIGEVTATTEDLVNADHPIGGTAMWAAAAGGAGTNIWRVYANGGYPNLNPRQANGSTPLQKALTYPDLKTAEMTAASLLSNNADPNTAINADQPALHLAASRGSLELTEMLVRLGAEVDSKNKEGKTAAQVAEYFGHQSVFELLKNNEQIPRTCRTSRTAYNVDGTPYQMPEFNDIPLYQRGKMVGNSHRNLEAVQKAVATDPRMAHAIATTSEKAVEAGAHMGNKEIVDLLLKNGAPYSLPTAVMMNDFTTVQRLLDEDPNCIHERGAHDFALLWYPIIGNCKLDMMQLLLDRGAKVEQQHFLGTTALHWACSRGSIEMVEMLLENGADVNRIGRKFKDTGETPLQISKDEKIIDYLKSKGAK
jgi:ankyrin repeat protein